MDTPASASRLSPEGWSPDVYARLDALLDPPHPPGERPLAVFDWDDTVVQGDLSLAMLRRSDAEQGTTWHDDYFDLLTAHGRPVAYPQITRWYAGWTVARFDAFVRGVVDDALSDGLVQARPPMEHLIRTLIAHAWDVHVVTASPGRLVRAMAPHVGIDPDRVHGMTLQVDPSGVMQDALDGPPTYEEGKATVVQERIGRAPQLVAGDSSSDLAMMTLSDHVLLIDGHDARLRQHAQRQGWMIQTGWTHTPAEPGVETEAG